MVVDSSVWLEILLDGPLAAKCQKAMYNQPIRVPALVLLEVYKMLRARAGEPLALESVAAISRHDVLSLTREVALLAGDICLDKKMGMADGMVLAHARILGESLLTLDNDFADVESATVVR